MNAETEVTLMDAAKADGRLTDTDAQVVREVALLYHLPPVGFWR